MSILTDQQKKDFLTWSEGNSFLYKLLCACGENDIPTFASCGGHEETNSHPYLGVIINNKTLPFIESILAKIQDMPDISVSINVRHSGSGQLYDDDVVRGISFIAQKSNCCEMFFKMKKGIEDVKKEKSLNTKAIDFFNKVKKLNETSRDVLQQETNNNVSMNSIFSTRSNALIEYEESLLLTRNKSKVLKLLRRILPIRSKKIERFEELQKKYGFLQREYKESVRLEKYRVDDLSQSEPSYKQEGHKIKDIER